MWPFNKRNKSEIKKISRQSAQYKVDGRRRSFCKLLVVNSKEFTIPEGLIEIGDKAFSDYFCQFIEGTLECIIVSREIQRISDKSFNDCPSLEVILVEDGNEDYSHIDGVLFNWDRTVLCRYPEGKCAKNEEYSIPKNVETIRPFAFCHCGGIKSVVIPGSVTRIGEDAFSGCSSLTKIEVEDNNSEYCSVDGALFSKDKKKLVVYPSGRVMKECTIPDSVTSIGAGAFSGCSSLSSIELPDSVTSIGASAFKDCSSLSSIKIPASVTSIGEGAFNGCSSLSSIELPDSVTSIGASAFKDCSSLSSIKLPDSVTSIGASAFSGCSSLPSNMLPDSETSIEASAFSGCSSLPSIELPDSVTSTKDLDRLPLEVLEKCSSVEPLRSGIESFQIRERYQKIRERYQMPSDLEVKKIYCGNKVVLTVQGVVVAILPRGRSIKVRPRGRSIKVRNDIENNKN